MTIDNLLAARHHASAADDAGAHYDRIYVHDLQVDANIGVHHHEKGATQRVIVSVDADILPAERAERIERTLSYDYLTEGVRAIVAEGHINLTETLAERIAAHVLEHPLAMRVTVRVEKVERIPGARLGVVITRAKPASAPAAVVSLTPEPAGE